MAAIVGRSRGRGTTTALRTGGGGDERGHLDNAFGSPAQTGACLPRSGARRRCCRNVADPGRIGGPELTSSGRRRIGVDVDPVRITLGRIVRPARPEATAR